MKDNSTTKLGGVCSILVGISYIIAGVTYFLLPPDQQAPPNFAAFMESVAAGSTILKIQFWAFGLGALLAIAAVYAISEQVYDVNPGWTRWSRTLAIVGFVVVAVQMISSPPHIPRLAAGYVDADDSARVALNLLGTRVVDPDGFLAFGLVGFWILVVNWLALRADTLPKPLAYIGLLGGVMYWLVVAGNSWELPILVTLAAALGGIVLGPIWYIWFGTILNRKASM